MPTEKQLKYWKSMEGKHSIKKVRHWKIKDTSNMGHLAWNKGLNGFITSGSFKKGHKINLGRKINPPIIIKCLICNKEFKDYASNERKYCSKKCKNISWINQIPKNGWNYFKDRTKVKKHQKRNDSSYIVWVREIKRRDKNTCRINNKDCSGYNIVHHILSWSEYSELRYNINNGITLCQAHHPRKRAEEKRLIPFFQGLVPVLNV